MSSSTILRKHLSIGFHLFTLVLLAIVLNNLVPDVSAVGLGSHVGGVSKSPSADLPVDSIVNVSNEVLFDRHTVLDKSYWMTLGDQMKLLDKWFGKPIASSTISVEKTLSESSTPDFGGVHVLPFMDIIYLSPKRTTATVGSSPKFAMWKKDNVASDETPQTHIVVDSKDEPRQMQTQTTATFPLGTMDDFEAINQDILENSVIAPFRLHPLTHPKTNSLHCPQKDVLKVSTHHEAQLHNLQYEPNNIFGNSILHETIIDKNEYDDKITITMHGGGTKIISFKGHKDHVVNIVLQLRGHLYESGGSGHGCENMRISAELRPGSASRYSKDRGTSSELSPMAAAGFDHHGVEGVDGGLTGQTRGKAGARSQPPTIPTPAHPLAYTDDFGNDYRSRQTNLWSSLAQLFDTSLLCEVLPSLSLRVPKVEEDLNFNFIIQSNLQSLIRYQIIGERLFNPNYECSMDVYLSQIPAQELWSNQMIFAVVLPLLVVFLPLPFLLRRADIIQVASLGIDVMECLWSPPYLLRRGVIAGVVGLRGLLKAVWHQHRRKGLQKRLEMRQRALAAQMQATMAEAQGDSPHGDSLPFKGAEDPPIPPAQADDAEKPEKSGAGVGDRPATTAIVIHAPSPSSSAEAPASRLHREYGKADDPGLPGVPPPHGLAGGPFARLPGSHSPTRSDILFPPDPSCGGEGSDIGEDERFCRICRDGDEDQALVAPCNCTGSVRWVHPSCLDHWRVESIKRNLQNVNTCEICKCPFKIKIRRSILIWQSCKSIVYGVILVLSCLVCILLAPLIAYGVFGEISCVAKYHHVPYATIYKLDGIMLSFFLYIEIILAVILARLIVYSWFRSSPAVETYIAEVHVIPRFMTWRNILKIALVTCVLIAQAISVGYLIKYLMYATSDIVWNWEASPLIGGILYIFFIFIALGVSVLLRERWMQSRIPRERPPAAGVGRGEGSPNNGSWGGPGAEGTGPVVVRVNFALPPARQEEGAPGLGPGRPA
ncbi:unnamed protein product [Phytomonas sp. Hart1]|nr:unnamed protein product [Phytomonas sp. Hart1]|eukprot:CCW71569.1 unnamed protein product [Phytomonas sp. isolate Hart1]